MPAWTDQIRQAAAAFGGGGASEAAGYAAGEKRLIDARSKRAQLDGRISKAALLARQLEAQGNFAELNSADPMLVETALAQMGPQISAIMQARGRDQKNQFNIAARNAAAAGDWAGANAEKMGVTPNPQALGGTVGSNHGTWNRFAPTPDNTFVLPTAAAQVNSSNATAALAGARQRFVAPLAQSAIDKNEAAKRLADENYTQTYGKRPYVAAKTIADARTAEADARSEETFAALAEIAARAKGIEPSGFASNIPRPSAPQPANPQGVPIVVDEAVTAEAERERNEANRTGKEGFDLPEKTIEPTAPVTPPAKAPPVKAPRRTQADLELTNNLVKAYLESNPDADPDEVRKAIQDLGFELPD